MSQKDVSDKIPIYKLKTKEEVMKYYDEWSKKNKFYFPNTQSSKQIIFPFDLLNALRKAFI